VLWCVGLPIGLVVWASATEDVVLLPAVESVSAGAVILVLGVALMFAGWFALTVYGRGLPMNVYPPTQYVTRGVYRFYGHPIYVGFFLACVGVSVACGSASGLWLVSPVVALSAAALVLGYERDALNRLDLSLGHPAMDGDL
jgi:protein-S-isoprenylcysteine O-methyltransferase Ste14